MTKTNVGIRTAWLFSLLICFALTSCIKSNSEPDKAAVPAGTPVKLEALSLNGTPLQWIIYSDDQENLITKLQPGTDNWSYLYITKKDNSMVKLKVSCGASSEVRARIYIHSALAKEAVGNEVELSFK